MHIVNLVDLYHILKQHEDHIAKQAGLATKCGLRRKEVKYALHQTFEVLLVLEDLSGLELLDLGGNVFHHLGQDVRLDRHVEVLLDVRAVGLADFGVLANVVVGSRVFGLRLEWVKQVFFVLEIFVNFPIDFDVLETPVEHDQDLRVDCPAVQVGDEAFKDRFESDLRRDLLLVFSVHRLEQIYSHISQKQRTYI